MKEMTIERVRGSLSQIIDQLPDGSISVCVITDGSTPVAKIVPITEKRPFGLAHLKPFLVEEEAFDALDEVIVADFGV